MQASAFIVHTENFSPATQGHIRSLGLTHAYDNQSTYDDPYLIYNPFNQTLSIKASLSSVVFKTFTAQGTILGGSNLAYRIYDAISLLYDTPGIYNNVAVLNTNTLNVKVNILDFTTVAYKIYNATSLLYDTPGIYNNLSVLNTNTLDVKANILNVTSDASIDVRSSIYATNLVSLNVKGSVTNLRSTSITIRSRLLRYAGTISIYDDTSLLYDTPGVYNNVSTYPGIDVRANIKVPDSIDIRASILGPPLALINIRGKVSKIYGSSFTSRALINLQNNVSVKSAIANTVLVGLSSGSRINATSTNAMASRGFIVKITSLNVRTAVQGIVGQFIAIRQVILNSYTPTLGIKARVQTTLQEFSVKALITNDMTVRARLSQRQGWPIADQDDLNYDLFVDTRNYIRASIIGGTRSTPTIRVGASVWWLRRSSMTIKASIIKAGVLSVKALVDRTRKQSTFTGNFNIQGSSEERLRMVFYVKNVGYTPTMQVGAMIVKSKATELRGTFLVYKDGRVGSSVHTFDVSTTFRPSSFMSVKVTIS
jgi:hypothetical protein